MLYTNRLVWESVYKICPHFKLMRDNKITVNLPAALKDCAVCTFLRIQNKIDSACVLALAEMIVGVALTELTLNGMMSYGTIDHIDQID